MFIAVVLNFYVDLDSYVTSEFYKSFSLVTVVFTCIKLNKHDLKLCTFVCFKFIVLSNEHLCVFTSLDSNK